MHTPFDLRTAKRISFDTNANNEQLTFVGGYDYNFVISNNWFRNLGEEFQSKTEYRFAMGGLILIS